MTQNDPWGWIRTRVSDIIIRQAMLIDQVNLILAIYKISEAIKDPRQIVSRLMMTLGL